MRQAQVDYPVILDQATKELHQIRGVEFIVGRSAKSDLPVFDPRCSRRQFALTREGPAVTLRPLSERSPTYCNDVRVVSTVTLHHGDSIKAANSSFCFLEFPDEALVRSIPQQLSGHTSYTQIDADDARQVTLFDKDDANDERIDLPKPILLTHELLIGRDDSRVDVCLKHLTVSRVHLKIRRKGSNAEVSDLRSSNGTFVNARRIEKTTAIRSGDRIGIGPYSLAFNGTELLPDSRVDNIELRCIGLTHSVGIGSSPERRKILDDVSLSVGPKELVCIIGPSGSGKSTLLKSLSARIPAESGHVLLNNDNLYTKFDELKRDIAIVPQANILYDTLTVREALSFTAKLRLPTDTPHHEIAEVVKETLNLVGLSDRADTAILHLSGGQKRRACLANEIICKPSLLFLDEVTSGLDEFTDGELMHLFRIIADGGKTIVCISHNLAHIEDTCHRIIVMLDGGKLGFIGTPGQARRFFGVDRLGHIYRVLAEQTPEYWQQKFAKSTYYRNRVQPVVEAGAPPVTELSERNHSVFVEAARQMVRQAALLLQRYVRVQIADKRAMRSQLAQCILVAVAIVLVFRGSLPAKEATVLFLLAISCLWFGCNNSARELIREKDIYQLERDINLFIPSYMLSKIVFLGFVGLLQSLVLLLIVRVGTDLEGDWTSQAVIMGTISLAGVAIGLLISALSTTTAMAISLVPLVLIPQIILSGALKPLEGAANLIGKTFVVGHWAYGGLTTTIGDRTIPGFKDWSFGTACSVVALHAFVGFVAAALVLQRKDNALGLRGVRIDQWLVNTSRKLSAGIRAVENLRRSVAGSERQD